MPSTKNLRDKLKPILSVIGESARKDLDEVLRLAEVGQAAEARLAEIRRIAGEKFTIPASASNGAAAPARKGKVATKKRGRPAAAKSAKGGARVRGEKPLREVALEVLQKSGSPMRVKDITAQALASGWKTTSSEPGKVVSAILSTLKGVKRNAEGAYELKK